MPLDVSDLMPTSSVLVFVVAAVVVGVNILKALLVKDITNY